MPTLSTITFPVIVNGISMAAVVEDLVPGPDRYYFEISFSNGFGDFFTLEYDKVYGTGEAASAYEDAIKNDLPVISQINTTLYYTVFQFDIGGKLTNVWLEQTVFEALQVYTVSYDGSVRFIMNRINERWHAGGSGTPQHPDEIALAKKIGEILDSQKKAPLVKAGHKHGS